MVSRRLLAPLSVSWLRAVVEGLLGYTLLLACSALFSSVARAPTNPPAAILLVLAWGWLILWPAYRLVPLRRGHWWSRLLIGILRALICGILLGLVGHLLIRHFLFGASTFPGASASVATGFGFLAVRSIVLLLAWLRRLVRRRLRWQLMASHALIIVLMLTLMAACGSLIGLAVLKTGFQPNAGQMAQSVAEDLRLSRNTGPFDRAAARRVFLQVESRYLPLRGLPSLATFLGGSTLPERVLLLDPSGNVIAGVRRVSGDRAIPVKRHTWNAIFASPSPRIWKTIVRISRIGANATTPLSPPPGGTNVGFVTGNVIGSAALLDSRGRLTGIVAVQTVRLNLNSSRFWQGVIALFSVGTVLLIVAAALPILLLSFLFAYLVARGLTRRLEAVSGVATAIAAGDLTQRAPITADNEIGRLAEDVNHMATTLEQTMSELRTARAAAEEALRTRRELVAGISHELRTPLAVIHAHLENLALPRAATSGSLALSRNGDVAVPPATIQALQSETKRLASLIDELFALSRVEAGSLQVHCEPIDVGSIADEIVSTMRPLAWSEGAVTLSLEAEPGLPQALADADRLRQIAANLLRNAVRHTPEGGIIVVGVARSDDFIMLSVADTGEGIAPDHLPHIFERFYRVDEARGRDTGGAGLGLAIVREFVELMGGRVTAESRPGEGSIFRVFLPVAPSSARSSLPAQGHS